MADSFAPGVIAHTSLSKSLSMAPSSDGRAFSSLAPDECFNPDWLALDSWGYHTATNGKGGKSKAHRLTYRLFVGPIPAGGLVLHRCGNPACINPFHLYIGDHLQNSQDRDLHGTVYSGKDLPQTKLSDGDVLNILGSVKRVTDLALEYGVSKSCISSIRSGRARTNAIRATSMLKQACAESATTTTTSAGRV